MKTDEVKEIIRGICEYEDLFHHCAAQGMGAPERMTERGIVAAALDLIQGGSGETLTPEAGYSVTWLGQREPALRKPLTTPRLKTHLQRALLRNRDILQINRFAIQAALDVIDAQEREIDRLREQAQRGRG